MDRYKETFATWNKVAHLYEEKFSNLNLYNDTYDLICNSLGKDNAELLDAGCGPGNITRYLLSKRPDFNIFGIDVASNMVALAQEKNPDANFAVMDIRQIHQLENSYDGIICGFCLPYLSKTDTGKFISDCRNLLNENGFLYLSFVEGESGKSNFQADSRGNRVYFYFHFLEDIKKQLVENEFDGFRVFQKDYKKSEIETEVHTILTANKCSNENM